MTTPPRSARPSGPPSVPARLAVPAATSARRLLADRGGLVSAAVFYLLVSVVLSALWRAAAGEHGTVAGYTAAELTWYVYAAEAAVCAIDLRLIEQVGGRIASGAVAVEMLRPLPVVLVALAVETGRCLARGAVLLVVGAAAAWASVGPPPDGVSALVAVVSLVLAVAANLALQHVVAGASFWLRDVRSAWFLYQKTIFLLGGMLLPLEVLPGPVHDAAMVLPFMAMAYAPARLAAGHDAPWLLAVQAGWLVVLVVAAVATFAAGERRMEVVGG